MKKLIYFTAAAAMTAMLTSAVTDPVIDHVPEGYKLVWSAEFNDSTPLTDDWIFEIGGKGWGNNEDQYYCAGGVFEPTGHQTAKVEDGALHITAYKIEPSEASDNRSYVSTRMNTWNSWQYGYIEMRAKLPEVQGTWPAFWMLPKDGKYDIKNGGGELDIMEWVGNEPETVWFSAHSQKVTTKSEGRYIDPATGLGYRHSEGIAIATPGEYHTYGMEWTHEYVKAYFDGVQYYYAPNPKPDENDVTAWPFDKEYYIKLNLAIGGSWGGYIDPDFTTATYEIDWVRVYQK